MRLNTNYKVTMHLDVTGRKLLHQRVNEKQDAYIDVLKPLFCPPELNDGNMLEYLAALLRLVGMEDSGWDPYAESRGFLRDMETLLSCELSEELFPDTSATRWRFALLLYGHVVEMDGPYDVLANLLRIQSHRGYSPYPFLQVVMKQGRKMLDSKRITVSDKIEVISKHAAELGYPVGAIFDDFYSSRLRNAVAHSDYTLATEGLRCPGRGPGIRSLRVPYADLLERVACAFAFIRSLFHLERSARKSWGSKAGVVPYDSRYKGLLEMLVDDHGHMCGFAVHWPNESVSMYRRTDTGVQMINCSADVEECAIKLMVGMYAQSPGAFSPLVETDAQPVYSALFRGSGRPSWPVR